MKKIENTTKYRTYGIAGMVGLFLFGAIVGYIFNGSDRINYSTMSKNDCNQIAKRIISAAGDGMRAANPELIAELNKVYSENCLDRKFTEPKPEPKPEQKSEEQKMPETTCGKIEMLLSERLYQVGNPDAEAHIDNAKIYANLSERGCPENSEKYKALAKQELEIARALNDDNLRDEHESLEIVETYKRLQMQAEAERMIEKAKKLTNPAIDFIIQLEKIIEE